MESLITPRNPFLLNFVQHHHHPMNSIATNSRASFPLRSLITSFFSTFSPKLATIHEVIPCRSTSLKNPRSKVSNLELKESWLHSLSSPCSDEDFGDVRPVSNADSEWVIGIDPDVSGALAVLKSDDSGCSAQVFDSPNLKVLVGKRIRRRLDAKAIVQLLQSLNAPIGTIAYIEQSLPYPQDGKQGWWCGGFNYGLWIGVLVASQFSVVPIPSLKWKNEFKLSGNRSTKDNSREVACSLFPSISSSLSRKKDHGRAEALLIAAYGKGMKLT